ncbi:MULTISPECIES: hypothetical protein [unclassified Streptomyces]|uniref:hypothetical protein n=1 Tax=unclassified Streptomyces TaxID=2593676 RepID=UPI000685CD5F|nr:MULTISPECIES: hypothetical protein [unclassified Streptomyces]MYT28371.1 hypothetical protein [Streptomyces sp. SID8354]
MPRQSRCPTSWLASASQALMYCAALAAGVVLVVAGRATPVEASGYVSPFLVIFEGARRRS